eukprot:SAG11_NODE_150_length_14638_cov_3.970493_3_plen_112_part_00
MRCPAVKQLQEEICTELGGSELERREYLLTFEARVKPTEEAYLASTSKATAGFTRTTAAALERLSHCDEAQQCVAEARISEDAVKIARRENNAATAAEVLREENQKAQQAA